MSYTPEEVLQYVSEEDVKFIRMAFCDVYGRQRNVAVMADELPRAFQRGIAFDASAIDGFDAEVRSDLFLRPDPSTLTELPWRPQQGRVARLFCDIVRPDGSPFEADTRRLLRQAVEYAAARDYRFSFGTEMEFYLFKLDARGEPTGEPFDHAGYMDVAPEDKGENVRREICLTLEQLGICPETSHHESGPGQNGLWADFSPRPLPECPGSGMHINVSAKRGGRELDPAALIPGLMKYAREMTLFLNPSERSYARLGRDKAPAYVTWSEENRSQLIRVPAARGHSRRLELRSPDAGANPYLAFALILYACLEGIDAGLPLLAPADFNTYLASPAQLSLFEKLPASLSEASVAASGSAFLRRHLPEAVLSAYGHRRLT